MQELDAAGEQFNEINANIAQAERMFPMPASVTAALRQRKKSTPAKGIARQNISVWQYASDIHGLDK